MSLKLEKYRRLTKQNYVVNNKKGKKNRYIYFPWQPEVERKVCGLLVSKTKHRDLPHGSKKKKNSGPLSFYITAPAMFSSSSTISLLGCVDLAVAIISIPEKTTHSFLVPIKNRGWNELLNCSHSFPVIGSARN